MFLFTFCTTPQLFWNGGFKRAMQADFYPQYCGNEKTHTLMHMIMIIDSL